MNTEKSNNLYSSIISDNFVFWSVQTLSSPRATVGTTLSWNIAEQVSLQSRVSLGKRWIKKFPSLFIIFLNVKLHFTFYLQTLSYQSLTFGSKAQLLPALSDWFPQQVAFSDTRCTRGRRSPREGSSSWRSSTHRSSWRTLSLEGNSRCQCGWECRISVNCCFCASNDIGCPKKRCSENFDANVGRLDFWPPWAIQAILDRYGQFRQLRPL